MEEQWISVKVKDPENKSFVLVHSLSKNNDDSLFYQDGYDIALFENGYFYVDLEREHKVTHWMPLPAPPKIYLR